MKFTKLTISGPLISNKPPPPSSIIWSGLLANDCVGFELNRHDWYQKKDMIGPLKPVALNWRFLAKKWVIGRAKMVSKYGMLGNKNRPQSFFKTADFMGFKRLSKYVTYHPWFLRKLNKKVHQKKKPPKLTKTTLKWVMRGAKMVAISYGLPSGKNWPQSPFKRAGFIGYKRLSKNVTHYPWFLRKLNI